ncbi:hypothetical protein ACXR2W_08580 [Leucobacter sp. HY1908]
MNVGLGLSFVIEGSLAGGTNFGFGYLWLIITICWVSLAVYIGHLAEDLWASVLFTLGIGFLPTAATLLFTITTESAMVILLLPISFGVFCFTAASSWMVALSHKKLKVAASLGHVLLGVAGVATIASALLAK